MTVDELYRRTIKPLPAAERFRLATRILADIPAESLIDDRDDWSDEDLRDFQAAGLCHIERELVGKDDA